MIFENIIPQNTNTTLGSGIAASSNQQSPVQLATSINALSIICQPTPPPASPKQPYQEALGPRISHVASRVGSTISDIVDNHMNPSNGGLANILNKSTKALASQAIDLEMIVLKVADEARVAVERTSLQELGETLHVFTDFVKAYTTVFAAVSTQVFATKEEENAAWMAAWATAGGPPWPAGFQPGAQTDETLHAYVQGLLNRVKENTAENFKRTVREELLLRNHPWIQGKVLGRPLQIIDQKVDDLTQFIDKQGLQLEGLLYQLSDRPQIHRTVRGHVDQFLTDLRTFGFTLPESEITDIPDHHLLVETIGSRQVVFHSSVPELIGMESRDAQTSWPGSVIVTHNAETPEVFGGRLSLKDSLKTAIHALLTGIPGALRNRACARLSRIPYIGKPLALLLRVIYWISALVVKGILKGINYFVGWPSADALSEEIARKLLLHMNNPAMVSVPALLLNRLFSILDGTGNNPNLTSGTSQREAFLGEPIVALLDLFKTICPSIFSNPYRFPRLVGGCINAALWVSRKSFSATVLVVVNPLTRKIAYYAIKRFSSAATKERNLIVSTNFLAWVQGSAITLWKTSDSVELAHSVLSSGYHMLGVFGAVSRDQSHFTRGNQSAAHLLHHTILAITRVFSPYVNFSEDTSFTEMVKAAGRRFVSEHFGAPDNMSKKLRFHGLLAKIAREEDVTEEEMVPVKAEIDLKAAHITQDRNQVDARIALTTAIPSLDLSVRQWNHNRLDFCHELMNSTTTWSALETNLAQIVLQKKSTVGESPSELTTLLSRIAATKSVLSELSKKHAILMTRANENKATVSDWKDLYSEIGRFGLQQSQLKSELLSLFQRQRALHTEELDALTTKSATITTPEHARECIQELLKDAEVLAFADARNSEEQRLRNRLNVADQNLQQVLTEWEAATAEHLDDENTYIELLTARENFLQAQTADVAAIRGINIMAGLSSRNGLVTLGATMLGSIAKPVLNPSQEKAFTPLETLNFYLPNTFQEFRNRHAQALAEKINLQNRIAKLSDLPLYRDPVWLLQNTGSALLNRMKHAVTVEPVITFINEIIQDV